MLFFKKVYKIITYDNPEYFFLTEEIELRKPDKISSIYFRITSFRKPPIQEAETEFLEVNKNSVKLRLC
ncbi:hypothetical protein MSSIH_1233 [Methanosarcina siciliae HI350]|uniref:Uncharacterized protein n=1 Tax=Methanosarcina siciliae HI350 TaxID=1434119 RepID=A0A0E3PCY0_9EURY|nr:hypothetical protein MSSIH_1233 [Methanosarcina siciliae HI350]